METSIEMNLYKVTIVKSEVTKEIYVLAENSGMAFDNAGKFIDLNQDLKNNILINSINFIIERTNINYTIIVYSWCRTSN
jgi:hypothetical protein